MKSKKAYVPPTFKVYSFEAEASFFSGSNPYWDDNGNHEKEERGENPYWSGGWGQNAAPYRTNLWE